MAVFRAERARDYTVMRNCHLRDQNLSLKAKGLLSMMLSLPEDWNFTTKGLAKICEAEYPTALVQERFEQITPAHIENVLDGIRNDEAGVDTQAHAETVTMDSSTGELSEVLKMLDGQKDFIVDTLENQQSVRYPNLRQSLRSESQLKILHEAIRAYNNIIQKYAYRLRPCLKIGGMLDCSRFFRPARRFDAGILTDFKSNQRSPGGKRCRKTAFRHFSNKA